MSMNIVIIGGGPAGYEAALTGATLGGQITLVEECHIGGTCLNYGCIPTKTLIEHGTYFKNVLNCDTMGIDALNISLNYNKVIERKDVIIKSLGNDIVAKLKKAGVNYKEGFGTVIAPDEVEVLTSEGETERVDADVIVLATGSKAVGLNLAGMNLPNVVFAKDMLSLDSLPLSVTVIGGGVIGMEFACLLNDFGVLVTVLEYEQTILPTLDHALGKRLKSFLTKKNITIHTGVKVTGITKEGDHLITEFSGKTDGHRVASEYVLAATGRIGRFRMENMDDLGIGHDGRFIRVDNHFKTDVHNIYAIGDVNGMNMTAHNAYDQGRQLMHHLLRKEPVSVKRIPACVFTTPEIASVGLSEEQAKARGISYEVQRTLYGSSGKAVAMNAAEGFVKTMIDRNGFMIGCHIMGAHASDLIHYGAIAMECGKTIYEIRRTVFAHPTLGELFWENLNQYEQK